MEEEIPQDWISTKDLAREIKLLPEIIEAQLEYDVNRHIDDTCFSDREERFGKKNNRDRSSSRYWSPKVAEEFKKSYLEAARNVIREKSEYWIPGSRLAEEIKLMPAIKTKHWEQKVDRELFKNYSSYGRVRWEKNSDGSWESYWSPRAVKKVREYILEHISLNL